MSGHAARPINTKSSLIWEKPEYPEGLRTVATQTDQGLLMSGQASQGSMPRDHSTKNLSHLGKSLSQQTKQGPDPSRQRIRMLYELDARR
jgi:hypothetical protein